MCSMVKLRCVLRALVAGLFISGSLSPPELAAQGATYHVSESGSDTGSGTLDQPFRTVQKAVSEADAGDTLLIHGGTYSGAIKISRSGEPGRPIVLRGAGDGPAVLTASFPDEPCSATAPTFKRTVQIWDGHDHWTIEGLVIDGGILIAGTKFNRLQAHLRDRSLPGRGSYDPVAARRTLESLGSDPAEGVRILRNRIRGRGIFVTAGRDGRIEANQIHDVECGTGAAIWLVRFSDGWTIRGNHIHDVAASDHHWMSEGIRLGAASMYNRVESNTVERLSGPGRGIATDVNAGWNLIRGNRVSQADTGFSEQAGGWGNQYIENVATDNRRFGFRIGRDHDAPDRDRQVPAFLQMRCNRSTNNPVALSIGSVREAVFEDNDFRRVKLSRNVRRAWNRVRNRWDGDSAPPSESPPIKSCSSTASATMP
jgi:hypothetical protein